MHYRDIFKMLGLFLLFFSGTMIFPLALAIYYEFIADPTWHPQPHSALAFFKSLLICIAVGVGCYFIGRNSSGKLFKKEGIALVIIIWVLTPGLAALPFIYSNTLENPLQAYFESVAGMTTTGATTLQAKQYDPHTNQEIPITKTYAGLNPITYTFYGTIPPIRDPGTHAIIYEGIEAVSRAVLLWRSLIQWLGGLGVVLLFVAIFPYLGISSKLLYQTEASGPIKDSIAPRVTKTALILWMVYCALTAAEFILLMLTGREELGWLEALTISLSTLSGGGSSIRNLNIGQYDSAYVDWIIVAFMILGSINFSIYYYVILGKFYKIYQPELWLYLAILVGSCGFAVWYLTGTETHFIDGDHTGPMSLSEAMRYGIFQIVAALTTTGFAIVDYDKWPDAIQALMIMLMFVGGMSGSTASGIKTIRHLIFFRLSQLRIETLFRSDTVRQLKLGGQEVGSQTAFMVFVYLYFVIAFVGVGGFLYVLDGIDALTATGLVSSMVNNVGLGFRVAGPTGSCAFLSNFSLVLSSALMIFGRLEFLILFAALSPSFWKQTS